MLIFYTDNYGVSMRRPYSICLHLHIWPQYWLSFSMIMTAISWGCAALLLPMGDNMENYRLSTSVCLVLPMVGDFALFQQFEYWIGFLSFFFRFSGLSAPVQCSARSFGLCAPEVKIRGTPVWSSSASLCNLVSGCKQAIKDAKSSFKATLFDSFCWLYGNFLTGADLFC